VLDAFQDHHQRGDPLLTVHHVVDPGDRGPGRPRLVRDVADQCRHEVVVVAAALRRLREVREQILTLPGLPAVEAPVVRDPGYAALE
jgi:hypothetical protein